MKDVPGLATIAAVLLDMDGTLVDSDAAVERAWAAWAREHGVDAVTALADVHNGPAERTVRKLLPQADAEAVVTAAQRQLALQYDDLSDVVAAPGAARLLETLNRWAVPWAVVTSADTTLARARLGAAGIDPPVLVTADDVANGKPDPEGYLLAARLLGVVPSQCLVVEDSVPGLAAGRAAGSVTATLRGLRGDVPLGDLTQLADLLEDVLSRPARPGFVLLTARSHSWAATDTGSQASQALPSTPPHAGALRRGRPTRGGGQSWRTGSIVTRRISSSSGAGQNTPASTISRSSDGST